ncbi:MAG: RNase adapter RapZ [Magnetococcales bacterium]|nr:RNase adapter RapZ [Magnetococcales bacterium]
MNPTARIARLVLVTGISGAGKSSALKYLEDLGFNWVDNLPLGRIPFYLDHLAQSPQGPSLRLAVGIHFRHGETCLDTLRDCLADLKQRAQRMEVLFLEADVQVLVSRYRETRRRHPFASDRTVREAIALEADRLGPLRVQADLIIDTTGLNVPRLKERLDELFAPKTDADLILFLRSFGFKFGANTDADMMMDGRFLANPFYDPALRPLCGRDEPVQRFLERDTEALVFLDRLEGLLNYLLPLYRREKKRYFTLDIGCTGGRHRSVYLVERLGDRLRKAGYHVLVRHRDLNRTAGAEGESAPHRQEPAIRP